MAVERIWTGSAWEDVIAVPANMVTTDTAQTLAGQKTFSLAPLVPDASFSIAKVSGLQTALDSKYSVSNPPPAAAAPANMLTTDTAQTVSGTKSFAADININADVPANPNSSSKYINFTHRSGSANVMNWLAVLDTGRLTYTSSFEATDGVYDGANRVYSASNPPPATDLSNYVTLSTSQTITGLKTFGNGSVLFTRNASEPATPAANNVAFYSTNDGGGIARLKVKYSDGTTASIRNVEPYIMAVTGTLTVAAGKSRVYLEDNYVVESIRASVNTAPAGASVLVDVNLNGTSIFTTQANRPAIIAGANTGLATLGAGTTTSIATGQYLTVDVDQIGSTTAGADLTVVIRLRRV